MEIIEIPAKFLGESGVIRLLGPIPEGLPTSADLFVGGYGRPFILDDGQTRCLHFDMRFIQSAMRIADPYGLEIPYTRMMMSCLLFVPEPSDILIVGLGGGSLAKFCHRYLPAARITAVESNPDVIAFREQFAVPEDERLRIVHADAAEYLPAGAADADILMLDGFDAYDIPPGLGNARFYQAARRRLRPGGLLVANLIGRKRSCIDHLRRLSAAFEGRIRLAQVPVDGNYLAFALQDPHHRPSFNRLERNAELLERNIPLDFQALARWLRNDELEPFLFFQTEGCGGEEV